MLPLTPGIEVLPVLVARACEECIAVLSRLAPTAFASIGVAVLVADILDNLWHGGVAHACRSQKVSEPFYAIWFVAASLRAST